MLLMGKLLIHGVGVFCLASSVVFDMEEFEESNRISVDETRKADDGEED